ncbi:2,6-dioxo-6-phenylhexa-3-enoate hydrolase [Sphaerisporangium krabiense]|uniref:alpha/beta fold hydrolase n=1 Tax=Sphaerisporangium krabiense TaxID=763782 RepID=UPI00161B29D5|nr:alpha/beta fold hydrolase [Sphaerisporangium krabiense]GII62087.1 2,6-dioxo-6-phenylhexa-3-enoate hydrolase [Sphaerisporangium krabiense]
MAETTERTVTTNGYSTFFLDSGDEAKEAVILLHGGGPGANAASNWRGFVPALSDEYRVLAPDLVGYGRTDHPEDMPSSLIGWLRMRVDQVLALMDAHGIEQAHLVGNSMGGALAMHLVMAAPERVRKVSLMGSAGGHSQPTPEVMRMVSFYKDPSLSALENLTKWFVHDENELGASIAAIAEERHKEIMRPEIRRSYECFFSSSPAEAAVPPSALRRMAHPFLLVHGREDRFVTPDSSVYLQRHLPNAELHIFPRCGHWVQIERADAYAVLLRNFLKAAN